jgi:Zinc binding domain
VIACCAPNATEGAASCPTCGRPGRSVSRATVGALARLEVEAQNLAARAYRFCDTPTCPVVYFAPEGVRIERDEVRVAVQQKDDGADVPLCYCFGYTRARLTRERDAAVAFISAEITARRCACDVKNPSGRCCLGDLRRFLRAPSGATLTPR